MLFLNESEFLKILISTLLRLIGIFKSPLRSIVYISVYVGCLTISLFGSAIGFTHTHGKVGKIESFVCLYINTGVNSMFLASILCRQNVKKLLNTMKNNPICFHSIIEETAKLVNVKIFALISAHYISAIIFVTPPLYVLIFQATFSESDKSSEIIPYWFACDHHQEVRFSNIFCWKIETKREFVVKMMLELVFGTISYFGYSFCFVSYCVIIAEFCVHLKILKCEIASLKNYADEFSFEFNQLRNENLKNRILIEHNKRMNYELVNVIKYVQYLRRCIREINHAFGNYTDVLIAERFFNTVLVVFMAFNKSENKMLFKCAAVCVHGLTSYILLCYFAQIISDTSDILLNEMTTIPWYNQCIKFRKTYSMVLAETCTSSEVKIFNARVLNLGFLLSSFKTTYSILNMLFLKVGRQV